MVQWLSINQIHLVFLFLGYQETTEIFWGQPTWEHQCKKAGSRKSPQASFPVSIVDVLLFPHWIQVHPRTYMSLSNLTDCHYQETEDQHIYLYQSPAFSLGLFIPKQLNQFNNLISRFVSKIMSSLLIGFPIALRRVVL